MLQSRASMNEEETNNNLFKIARNAGCFIGGFVSLIFPLSIFVILFFSILIYLISKPGSTKQIAFWLMLGAATAFGLFGFLLQGAP